MGDQKTDENVRWVEEQGATEAQNVKIDAIVGEEVLGYDGSSRGEHSGQASEPTEDSLADSLADNRPEQLK